MACKNCVPVQVVADFHQALLQADHLVVWESDFLGSMQLDAISWSHLRRCNKGPWSTISRWEMSLSFGSYGVGKCLGYVCWFHIIVHIAIFGFVKFGCIRNLCIWLYIMWYFINILVIIARSRIFITTGLWLQLQCHQFLHDCFM